MSGAQLIAAERRRQITELGRTPDRDSNYVSGELCDAAISYAQAAAKQARGESHQWIQGMASTGMAPWPWEDEWWKPSGSQVRNLVKAGALIAAEIDRLQRKEKEASND